MDTLTEVKNIIAEVLEVDAAVLDEHAELIEELGMDSVLKIDILTGIEKKFNIRIPDEHIKADFTNIHTIVLLVESLRAQTDTVA